MSDKKKLWGGRFESGPDSEFFEFNRSFGFDVRLFEADVKGCIAHCNSLASAGYLTAEEAESIRTGLAGMVEQAAVDEAFLADDGSEDVHSFIESKLFEMIGSAALKLHAGRSRNDQVATAFRIWVREAVYEVDSRVLSLQRALVGLAEANADVAMPGYTHLQKAQPILFAHWCLAYFEMLRRDRERLADLRKRANVCPLGSAALAGTSYNIDREAAAKELGFESVTRNSIDAVSDRDFCVEFVSAASLIMVHLARLAEDVILCCSTEFGFISLSDDVSTGSSIMPQKKNPDSMELVRGKSARVFGDLTALLTMIKGLPTAYNKDLQEDKEAVFDAFDTVRDCLSVTTTVVGSATVDREKCAASASSGYLNATELADYLSKKGVPFRRAHEITGKLVLLAIDKRVELDELALEDLKTFSDVIEEDVYDALSVSAALASKSVPGGTAPAMVKAALEEAKSYLLVGG